MNIESVQAIPVCVPRPRGMVSAATFGSRIDAALFGIVRVRTDDGIEGIGEISMNLGRNGAILCDDVNTLLAPRLVHSSAFDIRGAIAAMNSVLTGSEAAKAAVEMALFDICGKSLGVPVYQLLGGRVRESIPLAWTVPFGDPLELANQAQEKAAEGFRVIKVKIGRGGSQDRKTVAAIRDAVGPDIGIRVDANGAYRTPLEAVHELVPLEQYNLQLLEQPLPRSQLRGMELVRRRVSTPVLLDESMRHWTEAFEIARLEAADALNVYVAESGGLIAAGNAFAIGEAAGIPGLIGSQAELGIGTAAMAHLGVTVPTLSFESDLVGPLDYDRDIIERPLQYVQGTIAPPEGSGLGVTLDETALNEWRLD